MRVVDPEYKCPFQTLEGRAAIKLLIEGSEKIPEGQKESVR
jgi:hypothetical protein